jgi:FkbM family methyltransferase
MLAIERGRRAVELLDHPSHYLDNFYGLRDRPLIVQLKSGVRVHVRPRSGQSVGDIDILDEVLLQDVYRIQSHVRRQVVDIGAQAGYFSLLAASQSRSVRVRAFEPCHENFDALQANVALNPGLSIDPIRGALAASCGLAVLSLNSTNSGGHSVGADCGDRHQATRAFCLPAALGGFRGALLKVDIEGGEHAVIGRIMGSTGWSTLLIEEHRRSGSLTFHRDLAGSGLELNVLSHAEYAGEGRFQLVSLRRGANSHR